MQEKIIPHLTRWPVIIIAAFLHGFLSPPFNNETHWLLTPLPFLVVLGVVPFLYTAITMKGKQQVLRLLTWGAFHNFGTMWWLSKVNIDGLWGFILFGVFLLSIFQVLPLFFQPVNYFEISLELSKPEMIYCENISVISKSLVI